MQLIQPSALARPRGHYSPAVIHNGFVFVSGQLPMDAEGNMIKGSIEEQLVRCLENIRTILEASDSDISHVVKATIFITEIADWPKVNGVFANFFGDHRPARVVVPTGKLLDGIHVEVDCIAAVK